MENLKKVLPAVIILVAISAAIAFVGNILNKPANKSYLERFIVLVVSFAITFAVMSVATATKKDK